MENSIGPEVSPGAMAVQGVARPSASTTWDTVVAFRNAIDCPTRMVAGSGVATTQVFGLDGDAVSVTTTAGGSLDAVASVHASNPPATRRNNEDFITLGWRVKQSLERS